MDGPRSFPEVANFSKTYLGIVLLFKCQQSPWEKAQHPSVNPSIHPLPAYGTMSSACWPQCHRRRKAQVPELRAGEKPAGPQTIGKDQPEFERLHKDRSGNREKMIRDSMGPE